MSTIAPVVELKSVVKDYGSAVKTRILHDVDLFIGKGEFAALIGPSGSGKSTLLNIMGLLEKPTSGSVVIAGVESTSLDEAARTSLRGASIGFVFQFHHLLRAFTALENVYMPMLIARGYVDRTMTERARELLANMGLSGKETRRASDLSGGEQQRVAIARAMMMKPKLLLADEPTGNLDTETADSIFDIFRRMNSEDGGAWLIVTHDPRLADRCDRIVRIVDGRIVSDRTGAPAGPCRTCGHEMKMQDGPLRAQGIR